MPQARRAGSGSGSSGGSSRRTTSSSRSKTTGTRPSATSRSKSTGRSAASGGSTRARSTKSTAKSTAARSASSASSASSRSRATATRAAEAQLEVVAQRLRKLNERIIKAGREAGESTLTSYEKALKTIASTIERGPGSSDIEWVANMASAQAKFIREMLTPLTERARKALK